MKNCGMNGKIKPQLYTIKNENFANVLSSTIRYVKSPASVNCSIKYFYPLMKESI